MGWNKKKKSVKYEWRPVRTADSSKEEDCEKVVTDLQDKAGVSEVEETCSSSVLPDNEEAKAAEETSEHSSVKHSASIEVGASIMGFIKGKDGSMQKTIEEETGDKIIFPSSRNEDSVIIEGDSVKSITIASDKIQTIINEAVQSSNIDYSHFISLPLAIHPELVEKLFMFQNSILGINSLEDLRIDKSIFNKPRTFHLTVLMLKLWNKERVHAAKEVLQNISTKITEVLGGRPLSVRLKGLDCMRGSPANARVLYAPVEEVGNEDRLVRACEVIIDAYKEAGLVLEKDAGHQLKLHATLMKTRFKRNTWNKKFDSFDARYIFDKYGSEEWGEYPIREAHLSQRFVFDESGYYHCCASLPFPTSST